MLPRIHIDVDWERGHLSIGRRFFAYLWFNPRVWGIDYHFNSMCCVAWVVIGPFEIGWSQSHD